MKIGDSSSVTRASHKRKLNENKINYSAKKAKVKMMKKLVVEYDKIKSLNNFNNICSFQAFYDKKNLVPMVEERNPPMACAKSQNQSNY